MTASDVILRAIRAEFERQVGRPREEFTAADKLFEVRWLTTWLAAAYRGERPPWLADALRAQMVLESKKKPRDLSDSGA